jgi:hypothetical protein
VEFVVPKEERKGYYLQHQEEEKIKMPSDEEKNVTHRYVVFFRVLVLVLIGPAPLQAYRMTKG